MNRKGIFVISIDFEFAWGYADQEISAQHAEQIKREVEITRRLITLFEKYNFSATWAVVSRLLDNETSGADVLWSDTERLILLIKNSKVGHEIGSHSYSHIIYGAKGESPASVKDDIEKAKETHLRHGLDFKSFIFPRNSEAYHSELKDAGIVSFRAAKNDWYSFLPNGIRRILNMLSYFFPSAIVGLPRWHSSGLVEIPSGMLLLGRNSLRKIISPAMMIRKASRSIHEAGENGKIFHLWFHPSNFAYDTDTQFAILEEILKEADRLRAEGRISIMTMNDIATEFKK